MGYITFLASLYPYDFISRQKEDSSLQGTFALAQYGVNHCYLNCSNLEGRPRAVTCNVFCKMHLISRT